MTKELGLFDIFALATGATISGGFFLLPGIASQSVGPALAFTYVVALLPLLPGILSQVELATAMPRSGGAYYFVDRSLGPLLGTIAGLGVWLVFMLKAAFGLIGISAYARIFFPELPTLPLAVLLALLFGGLNVLGAQKTGVVQALLVAGVLAILSWFNGVGLGQLNFAHFGDYFQAGPESIIATAGLLSASFIGLSKVASVAEEVRNPERNLPRGLFLALAVSMAFYVVGASVMTGVVPPAELKGSLVPVALAAEILGGRAGTVAVTFAAVFAFASVANSGILSASRYPFAMARDELLPKVLGRMNSRNVPVMAVLLTTAMIIAMLLVLDAAKTAKLAGAFQLVMFSLTCLAVLVMRASEIESYDPGYRSPFFPYLHIVGALIPLYVVSQMGAFAILFSVGLVVFGVLWYRLYARERVTRTGAIYHFFALLGEKRRTDLDRELRGILKEKGLRKGDSFDDMIARASVLDLPEPLAFEEITLQAAEQLAETVGMDSIELAEAFLQGTRLGATPVSHGTALPHVRLNIQEPEVVMVRSRAGTHIEGLEEFWGDQAPKGAIHAIFFLAGPKEDSGLHLRILAQIAERVDGADFMSQWLVARSEMELKEMLLIDDRFLSVELTAEKPTARLIGLQLMNLTLPEGVLVAMIHRAGQVVIPRGSTELLSGDRLTIIGEPRPIGRLRRELETGLVDSPVRIPSNDAET